MKHLTPQEIDDPARVVPKEGESNWLPSDDFEAWAEDRAREYNELAADRFA